MSHINTYWSCRSIHVMNLIVNFIGTPLLHSVVTRCDMSRRHVVLFARADSSYRELTITQHGVHSSYSTPCVNAITLDHRFRPRC